MSGCHNQSGEHIVGRTHRFAPTHLGVHPDNYDSRCASYTVGADLRVCPDFISRVGRTHRFAPTHLGVHPDNYDSRCANYTVGADLRVCPDFFIGVSGEHTGSSLPCISFQTLSKITHHLRIGRQAGTVTDNINASHPFEAAGQKLSDLCSKPLAILISIYRPAVA